MSTHILPKPVFHRENPDNPKSLVVVGLDGQLLMYHSVPVASGHIPCNYLYFWIQTIEKAIDEEPSQVQIDALRSLLAFLQVCEKTMKQSHQAIVDLNPEAPSYKDYEDYMMYYLENMKKINEEFPGVAS